MAVDSDGGVEGTCRVVLESRGVWGGLYLSRRCCPVAPRSLHVGSNPRLLHPTLPPARSSNSPRRDVAPGTPCAGDAVSTRALRLRQARPGGAVLWLGATRVRGLRRRRCLPSQRACAWPSGRRDCAALAAWGGLAQRGRAEVPISSVAEQWGQADGRSVCPSVRWGEPATQWSMRLCLSLWCRVMGRELVNQWHFFVPWVMDGPRMRQKDEAAGAKQRAWLCWGLSSAGGYRAVTTSRTSDTALLLTTGTTSAGC